MSKNAERKLRRIKENGKNAKASNTKPSKASQLERGTQYAMNTSRASRGIAKTNQNAINGINADIEDIRMALNNLQEQINEFNSEMKRYDEKEVQPIGDRQDVLIDLFLQLSYRLDIDITDDQLDVLGLTYDEETQGDDENTVEGESDAQPEQEPDEGVGDDKTEDD